jgi:excisionase family DNA binding protein
LLDKDQAAAYLNTTLSNIEWLIRSRKIPFVRIPARRAIRFRRDDLDLWLENNTVEAVD